MVQPRETQKVNAEGPSHVTAAEAPPAKEVDPLREWARFVDQDSQSKTSEYLDESDADRSGE